MDKEIHCQCGKLLAKVDKNGNIKVWCKSCKKEVPLEGVIYENKKDWEFQRISPKREITKEDLESLCIQVIDDNGKAVIIYPKFE